MAPLCSAKPLGGQYNRESQEVQSIKNEVFSKKYRSFSDDKRNLAKDRENVSNGTLISVVSIFVTGGKDKSFKDK